MIVRIFKNNALNNGLLPVTLSSETVTQLLKDCSKNPDLSLTIDLENQVVVRNDTNESFSYEINPYKKLCLMNGYDDLDFLLSQKEKTAAYAETLDDWRILKR